MKKRSTQWHEQLEKTVFSNEESVAAYEAFRLQYELANHLKALREKANLSQAQVAKKMDTHKPAISRLESVSAGTKHLPSLLTLIKYADAVGCKVKIVITPDKRNQKKKTK